MSDKEKLEEMKNKVTGLTDSEGYFANAVSMNVEVYAWFYKQAERVQKLEEIKRLDEVERANYFAYQERLYEIDELTEQNKRYREALESIQDIQEWQRIEADFEVLEIVKSVLESSK